jgi:hypothetical protein
LQYSKYKKSKWLKQCCSYRAQTLEPDNLSENPDSSFTDNMTLRKFTVSCNEGGIITAFIGSFWGLNDTMHAQWLEHTQYVKAQ